MIIKTTNKILFNPVKYTKKVTSLALPNAAKRLNDIGLRAAKNSYSKQRKASGPSELLSSFVDKIENVSGTKVIGIIQAGGSQAPYAVWVNFGHRLRNGQWWEGYDFMGDGGKAPPGANLAIKNAASRVIIEEVKKIRV